MAQTLESLAAVDEKLSKRHIDLDPGGFHYLSDREGLIYAKHFTNVINERGLAVDPETDSVRGKVERSTTVFGGRTAKATILSNPSHVQ